MTPAYASDIANRLLGRAGLGVRGLVLLDSLRYGKGRVLYGSSIIYLGGHTLVFIWTLLGIWSFAYKVQGCQLVQCVLNDSSDL